MIELVNVCIPLGERCLAGLHLTIAPHQYAVLMGRTGCGKTSILEAICGLRPVLSGRVLLNAQDVTTWPPARRQIGYVPQDMALFTTMSVRDNLGYPLRLRRMPAPEAERRTGELASLLGIAALLDRTPAGLSGGEARRVALGRALSFEPQVLLLDEPLTGLDDETRHDMYALLRHVREATAVTVLHVTHSHRDVEQLADRRFELVEGKILESSC
jgi:ABC-type sugar transport system ATPase subunit